MAVCCFFRFNAVQPQRNTAEAPNFKSRPPWLQLQERQSPIQNDTPKPGMTETLNYPLTQALEPKIALTALNL